MSPDPADEYSSWFRAIATWVIAAASIAALLLHAITPRARLNVLQAVAMICYLVVLAQSRRSFSSSVVAPGRGRGPLICGILVSIGIYGSALGRPFLADDFAHVYYSRRPFLDSLREWFLAGQAKVFFRPIGFLSLWIDQRVFHRWPVGYHAVNLLLHLGSVLAVYFLCRELRLGDRVAGVASLFFAVLPIHAEPVAWMSARFDLLATGFALWALFFYVRARENQSAVNYCSSALLAVLAMLSKENAYAFPLVLISLEWFVMPQRRLRPVVGIATLAVVVFACRWHVLGGIGGYREPSNTAAVWSLGFPTLMGVLIRSPAQMLLGLNWLEPNAAAGIAIGALLGSLLLAVTLFVGCRPNRRPMLFAFSWMVIATLPAHQLASIGPGLTNSRILYLGSAGLAIFLALLTAPIPNQSIRRTVVTCLAVLFSAGLLYNLNASRRAADRSAELLTEVKTLVPDPPEGTEFQFRDLPETFDGMFFFEAGLPEAMDLAYQRDDLGVRICAASKPCVEGAPEGSPTIRFRWLGQPRQVVERLSD